MMNNTSISRTLSAVILVSLAFLHSSCRDEPRETPTQGTLAMISSEDVSPVIDLQVTDFTRAYTGAVITHRHSSARDAVVQLLNDSVKLIVIPREFNDEERRVIAKNELDVTSTLIAYDAVAVVVNEGNRLTQVTTAQLRSFLDGSVTSWSAVPGSGLTGQVVVAMGEPNSAVSEYVKQRLNGGREFAPVVLPGATTADVIADVQKRRNAVGFVPQAWLKGLPESLRVLEVGDPAFRRDTTGTATEYYAPHQAYIHQGLYAMRRSVYVHTHNAGRGVALGFTSFAAAAEGQKIIVKNGLVPATMPVRLVQLSQQ